MTILESERLRLRECTPDDAPFILALYNDPAFHEHIGDKGLRTPEDASAYLASSLIASYREHGYGLYVVERKDDGVAVGICGLVKRPLFDRPDIGFAFLEEHVGQGYGFESARAVLMWARDTLSHERILAIVSPGNIRSIKLLEKLGLVYEKTVTMADGAAPVQLFATRA